MLGSGLRHRKFLSLFLFLFSNSAKPLLVTYHDEKLRPISPPLIYRTCAAFLGPFIFSPKPDKRPFFSLILMETFRGRSSNGGEQDVACAPPVCLPCLPFPSAYYPEWLHSTKWGWNLMARAREHIWVGWECLRHLPRRIQSTSKLGVPSLQKRSWWTFSVSGWSEQDTSEVCFLWRYDGTN